MGWESMPKLIEDISALPLQNGHHHWLDDLPFEAQERLDLVLKRQGNKRMKRRRDDSYPALCDYEDCFAILKTGQNRTMHEMLHERGYI